MLKQFSIPNVLSVLLPVFVALYILLEPQYRFICAIILVVSGLTDIADGFIARKFHMETELGKILDPLADKMTLFTVALTLAFSGYKWLFALSAVLFVKELLMLTGGVILARNYNNNKMASSKWFGKFATALLYTVMFMMILLEINPIIELVLSVIMCVAVMFAFVMYCNMFMKFKKDNN